MDKKKAGVLFAIAGGVFLLVLLLFKLGFFQKFEYITYDAAAKQIRVPKAASDQVAVILIDDASLQALNPIVGRWPWPRALFSDFLDFIMMGEPRAVLFDILFAETHEPRDAQGKLSADDNQFVLACLQSQKQILAMQLIKDEEDEKNKRLMNRPLPKDFLDRYAIRNVQGKMIGAGEANNYYLPIPELHHSAMRMAVVEFGPDEDGVYRRTRPIREYRGSYFPVLGDAPFIDPDTPIAFHHGAVKAGNFNIPLDAKGRTPINVYGKFNTYSISGVFASLQKIRDGDFENLMVDPSDFKDKIIYVGASAVGVEDLKPTAMGAQSPGVYLHASLASNFLLNDFLSPARPSVTIVLILLFSFVGAAATIYASHFSVKIAVPTLAALALAGLYLYLYSHNQLIDFVPPFAALVLSGAGSFVYQLLTEGREKARVRRMFSQYVSPEVLNMMTNAPSDLARLGAGTKEDISVLFSDIRGFTTFSDRTTPEQVVTMLNTHFSHMTDAIFRTQGTIDKFIGDAIMAYWGAPVKLADHPEKAVLAAIEMTKRVALVNQDIKAKGIEMDLKIGIGINSGEAIVGNIGSERKLNFTVIGDTVNLASRLESLNKDYGAPIIISEFTRAKLGNAFVCRILDRVKIRGKVEPVRIFEAMVFDAADPAQRAAAEAEAALTERAFAAYEKGDLKTALELYNKTNNATLKELFRKRCSGTTEDGEKE